ncbi:MAG: c-type cytochrome [Bradyrhizobium sp.]
MKAFKSVALTAFVAVVLCAPTFAAARAQDTRQGDAANGKRVYLRDACFTCHGRSGQGGAYNGPAPILAQTALPFEGFREEIRNPVNNMPAYSDAVLSDNEIIDIYAFVESLPGQLSPKDISILNN